MKGKISKLIAIALAIASVCMMFIDPVTNLLETKIGDKVLTSTTTSYTFTQVLFGENNIVGATYIFVAYMLIAGGALVLLLAGFLNLKKKTNSLVTILSVLLMLVGGISLFFTKDIFVNVQTNTIVIELFKVGVWNNTVGPILGGILAILSSLVALVSIKLSK